MAKLRLRFGTYVHDDAEAAVSIARSALLNDQGIAWAIREQWTINGRLEADTQVEMTTKIQALEAAYKRSPSEVSLEFANTGADSAHSIKLTNAIAPIQVLQHPSYPVGFGAEYDGFRHYQCVIEGLTKTGIANSGIIDWQESVTVGGGYPRDVHVTTINTAPIRQRIANATPTIVRQAGSAASYTGWPIPSLFLYNVFTEAVLIENQQSKTTQAVRVGGTRHKMTLYRSLWGYSFSLPIQVAVPGPRRPPSIPVTLT